MRLLFAGTPPIAVPSLQLLAAKHQIVGVLTAPDRPSGRGRALEPAAVKRAAVELGLPLFQPERLGADARREISPAGAQLLVCVAYGKIFGPRFLALFPQGGLNLHPSLLPRYRGPAPIPAAILAGDDVTGVTIQALAAEMDAGDIYLQRRIALDGSETAGSLSAVAARVGAEALLEVVDAVAAGRAERTPQDHSRATYTHILDKEEGRIDWSLAAEQIERMVRAFDPWPLAFTTLKSLRLNILAASVLARSAENGPDPVSAGAGERSEPGKVTGVDKKAGILVQTGNGMLSVQKLQLQNRKPLDWKSFLNGVRDLPGTRFGG
ncbi:methionyl-tRNA formyltransferase [Salinispira pacifica]